MRFLVFLIALFVMPSLLCAQVDLSKYYNSDAFKISNTEYDQEGDLEKFKHVNPQDVEGFLDRGIEKMEEGLFQEAITDFDEVIRLIEDYSNAYYLRGICYTELDSLTLAEKDLNKAIEIYPVFAPAYTQLGMIYWRKDDIKKSKNYFDKAYELDETDLLPVFYKCNIALYHERNLPKTKRLLNKVIRRDSTFAGAYFFKAAIKMAEGYNRAALKNFDNAILYNPQFSGAYLWRGFTLLTEDDVDGAEADFSKLLELNPEEADFWALRSFLRIEIGDYADAVDDMIQCIKLQEIDDDNYEGGGTRLSEKIDMKYALNYFASNEFHFTEDMINHLEIGLCLLLEEKYDDALMSFKIAQDIDTTEAAPYFLSGLSHEYQEDLDEALISYSKALKRDKDIYDAYKKRGMIYSEQGEIKRAYVDFSHMIRLKPASKLGWQMRAHIKMESGDYVGAVLEYNEAYKLDSTDLDITFNRGVAREQIKNFKGAIEDFNKVLEKRNYDSECLYHMAFCTFQVGDTLAALELCDSSLAISSYNAFAHNLKGQIKCAVNRHHEGIFSFNKAISMEPNQIVFIYNRAIAFLQTKNYASALKDLNRTIEAFPTFGEAYYFRAQCFMNLQKQEEASTDFKKADELGYAPASNDPDQKAAS